MKMLSRLLTTLSNKPFENTVGKGENAVFSPVKDKNHHFR